MHISSWQLMLRDAAISTHCMCVTDTINAIDRVASAIAETPEMLYFPSGQMQRFMLKKNPISPYGYRINVSRYDNKVYIDIVTANHGEIPWPNKQDAVNVNELQKLINEELAPQMRAKYNKVLQ